MNNNYCGFPLDDLKKHYKDNKLSEKFVCEVDTTNMDKQDSKDCDLIENIIKKSWNINANKYRKKPYLRNYTENNPMVFVRDVFSSTMINQIADKIEKQDEKYFDIVNKILDIPDIENKIGALLGISIDRVMKIMDYQEYIETFSCVENQMQEDFNCYIDENYPYKDFIKHHYHTRNKKRIQIIPLEELTPNELYAMVEPDLEEKLTVDLLRKIDKLLNEKEILIVKLILQGKTQEEIATVLGYDATSTVSKKIKKIREKINNTT